MRALSLKRGDIDMHSRGLACLLLMSVASPAWAGLYYSGETLAELPSQWRGFLLDHRALRNIAVPASKSTPASPARERYLEQAAKLEKIGLPSADELADLGAIYVRLGQFDKAIDVLRKGQRQHPEHFRITANLGTAWQLQGNLNQAVQKPGTSGPGSPPPRTSMPRTCTSSSSGSASRKVRISDDLLGIRFLNDKGEYEPGACAAEQKAKLPRMPWAWCSSSPYRCQPMAGCFWQLAELANARGDVTNAAAMMDGCVTTFGLANADLRRHRQLTRTAADQLAKQAAGDKKEHKKAHVRA